MGAAHTPFLLGTWGSRPLCPFFVIVPDSLHRSGCPLSLDSKDCEDQSDRATAARTGPVELDLFCAGAWTAPGLSIRCLIDVATASYATLQSGRPQADVRFTPLIGLAEHVLMGGIQSICPPTTAQATSLFTFSGMRFAATTMTRCVVRACVRAFVCVNAKSGQLVTLEGWGPSLSLWRIVRPDSGSWAPILLVSPMFSAQCRRKYQLQKLQIQKKELQYNGRTCIVPYCVCTKGGVACPVEIAFFCRWMFRRACWANAMPTALYRCCALSSALRDHGTSCVPATSQAVRSCRWESRASLPDSAAMSARAPSIRPPIPGPRDRTNGSFQVPCPKLLRRTQSSDPNLLASPRCFCPMCCTVCVTRKHDLVQAQAPRAVFARAFAGACSKPVLPLFF
jgi:hypothetical protein